MAFDRVPYPHLSHNKENPRNENEEGVRQELVAGCGGAGGGKKESEEKVCQNLGFG